MSVKAERLKGYLLEEALVYLLRNAGFRLLTDPRQAPGDVEWRGSGLAVRGRGAAHQVDVLGDMAWVPAFAFPVRLWLEAKFRAGRAGIEEVRNAVGVLRDVNGEGGYGRGMRPAPRRRYAYALASAAGFTRPAAELALAHGLSLLDLSGGEYAPLLEAVEATAETLAANIARFKRTEALFAAPESGMVGDNAVAAIRQVLRAELGTSSGQATEAWECREELAALVAPVLSAVRVCDELFVAVTNGPQMVLLKADDNAAFVGRMTATGRERVAVAWNRRSDGARTWTVRAAEDEAFRLSFRLPEPFADYLLAGDAAGDAACLAVYRFAGGRDQIFRLEFSPGTD